MGVRGLNSFIENERQTRRIKIVDEIQQWKRHINFASNFNYRRHPNQRPIIVIDFYSLAFPMVMQYHNESVCGGRHQRALNAWKKLLEAFKASGCSLVFVVDLKMQESKIDEWLSRRNSEFKGFIKLYNVIDGGEKCPIKVAKKTSRNVLQSLFNGMAVTAQSYGRLYYSVRHEADVEIARYANQHKAMAIISNDSDFFIFKGLWRLWSSAELISSKLRLRTIEYNRKNIERILSLSVDQLPVFASLMGNDIIVSKPLYLKLDNFFKKIDSSQSKIRNVAKFIRDLSQDGINFKRISDNDIRQIIEKIFGRTNGEWEQLIRSSIDSYNTDYAPAAITDPIEAKLSHSSMYRPYIENMGRVQVVLMSYYDLRDCTPEVSLPGLLVDWMRRRKGILMNGVKDPENTFIVLVKKKFEEKCMGHTESLTYPDFSVPALDNLYSRSNDADTVKIFNEIRWKLFGWIMSFSDATTAAIKELPKNFLLICATLCALVKHRLMSVEAADGILYTENAIHENNATDSNYPKTIEAANIRAAHIYNVGFGGVRENFAIAGLLPVIEQIMGFDGVFFQKHMEMAGLNAVQRKTCLTSIQKYRIYASIE